MPFIGNKPTAVPLTSSDLEDNIVTSAKITDGTIALADLSATGTKDATTFLRGDNTFASAGGVNTPIFSVYLNTDLTGVTSTFTKIPYDAATIDTASAFDITTNHRFTVPSGQAGRYLFTFQVNGGAGDNNTDRIFSAIYKNGSRLVHGNQEDTTAGADNFSNQTHTSNVITDASVGDYFEIYIAFSLSAGTATVFSSAANEQKNRFEGFKLID